MDLTRNQKTSRMLQSALLSGLLIGAAALAAAEPPSAPSTTAWTEDFDHVDKPFPPVHRSAPFTPKVLSLLPVLTLDEKISLVHGAADPTQLGNVGYLPGVPRLSIPPRRDADAFGIQVAAYATAAPTRLGLGATFDREAVLAWGQVEGNEGRALGVDLLYGPQVDLTRQPNWQRNDTTYGDDPFLSGQLAIQEVTGIQSRGLMSEVKHFAFYNGQAGAGFGTPGPPLLPTIVDDQTAHELYLKDYEYPVTHAKPSSIMDSYQGFQIVPLQPSPAWASDNPLTLTTILRGQWDFRGFVLSDYGATHSVHSLLSGQDQEYPGSGLGGLIPSYYIPDLPPLVDPTSTSYNPLYARELEVAAARVLYAYERFGLLECASPAGPVAGCAALPRPDINDIKAADAVTVERLSELAAVLLKNDGTSLPLQGAELDSVAVIGPTARQTIGRRQSAGAVAGIPRTGCD